MTFMQEICEMMDRLHKAMLHYSNASYPPYIREKDRDQPYGQKSGRYKQAIKMKSSRWLPRTVREVQDEQKPSSRPVPYNILCALCPYSDQCHVPNSKYAVRV